MATVSFDEKVVVTDPEMVAKMHKDLEDPTPVNFDSVPTFTYEKAEENAKKWISTYLNKR